MPPPSVPPSSAPPPLSPLDVLLQAMRQKWQDGDVDGATSLARAAAPYLHPRHAALRLDNPSSAKGSSRAASPAAPHLLTDAQLDLLLDDTGGESEGGSPGSSEGGAGAP